MNTSICYLHKTIYIYIYIIPCCKCCCSSPCVPFYRQEMWVQRVLSYASPPLFTYLISVCSILVTSKNICARISDLDKTLRVRSVQPKMMCGRCSAGWGRELNSQRFIGIWPRTAPRKEVFIASISLCRAVALQKFRIPRIEVKSIESQPSMPAAPPVPRNTRKRILGRLIMAQQVFCPGDPGVSKRKPFFRIWELMASWIVSLQKWSWQVLFWFICNGKSEKIKN